MGSEKELLEETGGLISDMCSRIKNREIEGKHAVATIEALALLIQARASIRTDKTPFDD